MNRNYGQAVALAFSVLTLVWVLAESNASWRTDKAIEAADSRWVQSTQSVLPEAGPPTGLRVVPKSDKPVGYAKLVGHTSLIPNVDALLVEDSATGSRYLVILTKVSGYGVTICRQ